MKNLVYVLFFLGCLAFLPSCKTEVNPTVVKYEARYKDIKERWLNEKDNIQAVYKKKLLHPSATLGFEKGAEWLANNDLMKLVQQGKISETQLEQTLTMLELTVHAVERDGKFTPTEAQAKSYEDLRKLAIDYKSQIEQIHQQNQKNGAIDNTPTQVLTFELLKICNNDIQGYIEKSLIDPDKFDTFLTNMQINLGQLVVNAEMKGLMGG